MKRITWEILEALIGLAAVSIFVAITIGFGRLFAVSGFFDQPSCVPDFYTHCQDALTAPDSIGGYLSWGIAVWIGLALLVAMAAGCYTACRRLGALLVALFAECLKRGK